MLLHWDCHTSWERNPDTRPVITAVQKMLIRVVKLKTFLYDENHWWMKRQSKADKNTSNMLQALFPNQQLKLD